MGNDTLYVLTGAPDYLNLGRLVTRPGVIYDDPCFEMSSRLLILTKCKPVRPESVVPVAAMPFQVEAPAPQSQHVCDIGHRVGVFRSYPKSVLRDSNLVSDFKWGDSHGSYSLKICLPPTWQTTVAYSFQTSTLEGLSSKAKSM